MNDLQHVGTFFLLFALVLLIYGLIIAKTGDRNLLPYRAMHSVRNKADVRYVGRVVVKVALVIGVLSFALRVVSGL